MRDPVEIATKQYYWKPGKAYFEAFQLNAYKDEVLFPEGRVLDLGCGQGYFAQMLKEMYEFESQLIGADVNPNELRRAARLKGLYSEVLAVDAKQLPFKDRYFDAVLANQMLYYFEAPGEIVREIARVLQNNGQLICTVATDSAEKHYWQAQLIERFGFRNLAHGYRRRLNTRFGFVSTYSPIGWVKILEDNGLEVQKVIPYISKRIQHRWVMLNLAPFRVAGAIKFIRSRHAANIGSALLKRMMARSFSGEIMNPDEEAGDHILLVAQK